VVGARLGVIGMAKATRHAIVTPASTGMRYASGVTIITEH
jgi:hypothetical protein